MNEDLKIIKKKYGEKMMHLCRSLFPSILEQPGLLSSLMLSHFEPSRFLYDDITENGLEGSFKNYIYNFLEEKNKNKTTKKKPSELLDYAGYILYECQSEEDIQSFRRYYKKGEELCTFNGRRLDRCHVFFAVKKNVGEIKRENFENPKREDEYGTSVISIQFSKGDVNTLSIKNRYNHTVNNPDATFSNNLDNIIVGLTESFEKEYNLNLQHQKTNLEIPGYVQANDGKFYKYNYEINNVYYCPNNIIIDNFEVVDKYTDKEKFILADYFIIDLVNKKIELYDNIQDSFIDTIKDIDKINITKSKETGNKTLEIITKDQKIIIIELDKTNRIIGYHNEHITEINNKYLQWNTELINISLPNLIKVGNNFLFNNMKLDNLNLPNLEEVGNYFLNNNTKLSNVSFPKLKKVGNSFLHRNTELRYLNLPSLIKIDDNFLYNNIELENIELPNLIKVGYNFLYNNNKITSLNLQNLEEVGNNFLFRNRLLNVLNLPKLAEVGDAFLLHNNAINNLTLPNLTKVGNSFLYSNSNIVLLNLPNLTKVGDCFLCCNIALTNIDLPKLSKTGADFLYQNWTLENINLPNLEEVGYRFLNNNTELTSLNMEKLKKVGANFLYNNTKLSDLKLPNLIEAGANFLYYNTELLKLELPNLTSVGSNFLSYNTKIINLSLPSLPDNIKNSLNIQKQYIYQKSNKDKFSQSNIKKTKKTSKSIFLLLKEKIKQTKYIIKQYNKNIFHKIKKKSKN